MDTENKNELKNGSTGESLLSEEQAILTENKRINPGLNGVIYFFFIIAIFRNIVELFTNITKLETGELVANGDGFEFIHPDAVTYYTLLTWYIVFTILFVVFAFGILAQKKWGLIGLYILGLVSILVSLVNGDLLVCMTIIGQFVFWSFILMFKKNGISGWKLILNNGKIKE
ncbi:hypothetical protein [Hoylesella nanceiensis]|uniref:hypothetical protein n=1 Tax=Hoylesella nanceiensis TaxID=425941 RepID=UPI001CB41C0C|nr:hypothetical protein [Hoylesella nanceiensis]MBF1439802.1 hypothetical protein [Hoylesella nanceiensis]